MGEVYKVKYKKWGVGSIALFLSIFATSFSYTYILSDKSLGGTLLSYLQIEMSPFIVSIILYFIAILVGFKFKEDYGAKAGRIISVIALMAVVTQIILSIIP